LALLGEAGPEAVVPLGRGGAPGAPNVQVTINAPNSFFDTPDGQARFARLVGDAVMRTLRAQGVRVGAG